MFPVGGRGLAGVRRSTRVPMTDPWPRPTIGSPSVRLIGPGGLGVAEVAVRRCRLPGMSAQLSGVLRAGDRTTPIGAGGTAMATEDRATAWVGVDIGKTPHWLRAVDETGRPRVGRRSS